MYNDAVATAIFEQQPLEEKAQLAVERHLASIVALCAPQRIDVTGHEHPLKVLTVITYCLFEVVHGRRRSLRDDGVAVCISKELEKRARDAPARDAGAIDELEQLLILGRCPYGLLLEVPQRDFAKKRLPVGNTLVRLPPDEQRANRSESDVVAEDCGARAISEGWRYDENDFDVVAQAKELFGNGACRLVGCLLQPIDQERYAPGAAQDLAR